MTGNHISSSGCGPDCRNSNPYGRCEGEKRKGGMGRGEKKIRLPDIIALSGNFVRWQTELLIGAESEVD